MLWTARYPLPHPWRAGTADVTKRGTVLSDKTCSHGVPLRFRCMDCEGWTDMSTDDDAMLRPPTAEDVERMQQARDEGRMPRRKIRLSAK